MGGNYCWEDEQSVSAAYIAYVEQGAVHYLDGDGRRDILPVTFNYERWLSEGAQRLAQ